MSKRGGHSPRTPTKHTTEEKPLRPPEPYVATDAVADFIGVTTCCIRKWREKGRLPFPAYKCGAQIRFKLSEVDAWLREQRHFNTAEARMIAP